MKALGVKRLLIALLVGYCAAFVHMAEAATPQLDAAFKHSLSAFFASSPTALGAKAELINIANWPDIKGAARWSLPNLKNLPKRVSLIAEQGHGKMLRRWYVAAQVKWISKVVVMQKDVSARTMLDESMLSIQSKNIAGLRGNFWQHTADVVGLQTLRNLRRGDVLVSSIVKRPPLIKRGDMVTILVQFNGIQVSAEGIALKSGSRGDRMPVQNIRSKQTLQSIVQDAHTVSIPMSAYQGGV